MNLVQATSAITQAQKSLAPQALLVSTMSAMFALDALGVTERRLDSVPLMGGAAGLGLGLSLARPDLPVIVLDGDASLLMELGGLVTVAHNKPKQFVHFVCVNGVQFNGARNLPTAGVEPTCDFVSMALAAGYQHAERIVDVADLTRALPALLERQGATFVELVLEPDAPRFGPHQPVPLMPALQFVRMRQEVLSLKAELAAH